MIDETLEDGAAHNKCDESEATHGVVSNDTTNDDDSLLGFESEELLQVRDFSETN